MKNQNVFWSRCWVRFYWRPFLGFISSSFGFEVHSFENLKATSSGTLRTGPRKRTRQHWFYSIYETPFIITPLVTTSFCDTNEL